MKFSIRTKLLAAFAACLCLTIALGTFAIVQVASIKEKMLFVDTNTLPSLKVANQINFILATHRIDINRHIANRDPQIKRDYEEEMLALESQMNKEVLAYEAFVNDAEERALFQDLRNTWPIYIDSIRKDVLPLSNQNQQAEALVALQKLAPLYDNHLAIPAETLMEIDDRKSHMAISDMLVAADTARIVVIVISIVAAIASAAMGYFLSASIVRNITILMEATRAVAAGDLKRTVDVRSGDELGMLASSFNQMTTNLHHMTSQVQQACINIVASATEIVAASTQQAASAAEQSAAIAETTATIQEVRNIAIQTAQQAGQVAQNSNGAIGVSREGTEAIEETVAGMLQIRRQMETIAQTILSLADQTQAIGTIISTVNELANQSNLLALNAAIEAARAGQQGKSFAVVAQHVRELAERSKDATNQVQQILIDIQRTTHNAVLVTEEGSKGVDVGGRLAAQAGPIIHRIAEEVERGAQANIQMAAAAQQQTVGMEQIGQAMSSIQQATTQSLASTRQAERAAQDLNNLARSLQKAITVYNL